MDTFDNEVTLIGEKETGKDEYGNPIKEPYESTILCNEKSVYGADFYNAATVGLKPECVLTIHRFEYRGEEKVRYNGQRYHVLRTYGPGDLLELTVGDKIGD